jgi:uncharacterized membrane protein
VAFPIALALNNRGSDMLKLSRTRRSSTRRARSSQNKQRFILEALEQRVVLTTIDLTGSATDIGVLGGAIFRNPGSLPPSFGNIHPFLLINDGVATGQGYNTSARPVEFDESPSFHSTHDLNLADVPLIKIGPESFREFVLDLQLAPGNTLISLDDVKIFLGPAPGATGYPAGLGTLIYDMQGGQPGSNEVKLTSAFDTGSGDMRLDVPGTDFTGGNTWVYVYSSFGGLGGSFAANNASQQWDVEGPKGDVSVATDIHLGASDNGNPVIVTGQTLFGTPTVHDSSTVTVTVPPTGSNSVQDSPIPTGTVTYTFYNSLDGSGPALAAATVPLNADGTVPESNTVASGIAGPLNSTPGTYSFVVSYSGDQNYMASTDDPETLIVKPASKLTTTTTSTALNTSDVPVTTVALGSTVHPMATITSAGGTPTGTVVFNFYQDVSPLGPGPEDKLLATSDPLTLTGGSVDATTFAQGPLHAGDYYFTAVYSGDSTYAGSTDAYRPVHVNQATLGITTAYFDSTGSALTGVLGEKVYDTAAVTGAVAGFPTGAITFTFDNNNATQSGGGTQSLTEGPLHAGGHVFNASVAGNSDYVGATSTDEPFTINQAKLGITTAFFDSTGGALTGVLGEKVYDTAAVTGAVAGFPTGAITFTFDNNNATQAGGGMQSVTEGPLHAGGHVFNASVAGNSDYVGATSTDEPFTINQAKLGITTAFFDSTGGALTGVLGEKVYDTAAVTGTVAGFPTGAITFTFDSNNATQAGGGTQSVTEGPLHAGGHVFNASVAGNSDYVGATSTDEPLTINQAKLGITTAFFDSTGGALTGVLGEKVYDTAAVTGAVAGFPTGAITFTFDSNNATQSGGGTQSVTEGPLHAGGHVFNASVAGNSDYVGATSTDEPFTINPATLTLTTTIHNASGGASIAEGGAVPLGTSVYDTTAVSGAVAGFPVGTISYTFNGSAAGNGLTSNTQGPLHANAYVFQASIATTPDYVANPISAEHVTVNKADTSTTVAVLNASNQDVTGQVVAPGTVVYGHATVTSQNQSFGITGTVTYEFFANVAGTGSHTDVTVALGSNSTPQTLAAGVGGYSYVAIYNGNGDYNSSTSNAAVVLMGTIQQGGAGGLGYYSNKNGERDLTGSTKGTALLPGVSNFIKSVFANPSQPGKLVLVGASGYLGSSDLDNYATLRSFLLGATATNMAYMLSAQLLAAELNVYFLRLDASKSLYVPSVPGMSQTLQNALKTNPGGANPYTAVSNSGGVAGIQAILNAAKAQLAANVNTTGASGNRVYQEALKDCLDGMNNNQTILM